MLPFNYLEMLWVAPELLPITVTPGVPASQKGDVYSFGIILEEIIVRGGPYEAARQYVELNGNRTKINQIRIFCQHRFRNNSKGCCSRQSTLSTSR